MDGKYTSACWLQPRVLSLAPRVYVCTSGKVLLALLSSPPACSAATRPAASAARWKKLNGIDALAHHAAFLRVRVLHIYVLQVPSVGVYKGAEC